MNYQDIQLCYFRKKPFVTLALPGQKEQVFSLKMMELSVQTHIKNLTGCINALVQSREEKMQSQLGFELGIAEIIRTKIQHELQQLTQVACEC